MLALMKNVDLISFLSYRLTHAADNVKARTGVGNLFCTADRFKTEKFSPTGLKKNTIVQQRIFITIHISYYNFGSMRTLSLFCRNETLPPRDYRTQ